jgi:hypothetical protein
MDLITAFNLAVCVSGALCSWGLKLLWEGQRDLARRLEKLPNEYTRRDDFKETAEAIFRKLDRIEEKLDRKADK